MWCTESAVPTCTDEIGISFTQASPQTWGTILTLLEIFARSASATESIGMSAAVPVHQWPETVKALRDYYYTRYPARRSSALVLPPSASSTDCGSKSPPRERILDAPIAVTADVVSEQGTSPGADAGETLRTPSLSSGTAAVLADPLTCKNTLPQTKVKVESGDLETLGYELAARPVCVRRLNQIHLEELFPTAGNEPVMCTACMTFSCPAETPIEDLSAHMEKQHPELFEVILTKTEGMSPEEIVAWFATLDD
ncbi:hypothetical protein B0H19DRAFT_1170020 [Mycena capillaripes]|nr:hypothetical protein B0H19DRAFT_1170020 [Mycena capillaripes]